MGAQLYCRSEKSRLEAIALRLEAYCYGLDRRWDRIGLDRLGGWSGHLRRQVGPIHFVALNTETDFPGAEESKTGHWECEVGGAFI